MIEKVAVIGAGIMGSNIALTCALAGIEAGITDSDPGRLEGVRAQLVANLEVLRSEAVIASDDVPRILGRISLSGSLAEALAGRQLVIEAIVEHLPTKQRLFSQLEELTNETVLLTSNSSTFPISLIAKGVSNSARCCGLHWYNPAHLMPLVEVVPARETDGGVVKELVTFLGKLHKQAVICKESPGFVGVRLQMALVTEAVRMLEEGLASPEDIDLAVRLSFGFRLALFGPLTIMDYGGLDTFLSAGEFLTESLKDERFRPSPLMKKLVDAGKLGLKSGEGFFDYRDSNPNGLRLGRDRLLIAQLKNMGLLKSLV